MNKQRKVLITTTYNEMGIIIDTKAEEVAQPNLQPTCNQLVTDTISRQDAIDICDHAIDLLKGLFGAGALVAIRESITELPPAQPDIIRCRNCKFASGDSRICMKFGHSPIGELDFCAWAERRTDG